MAPSFFSKSRSSPTTEDLGTSKSHDSLTKEENHDELVNEADLPPVVARMVVEIRSDGSRTVARGALEDLQSGERVSLQADAATPVALARELTKALIKTPVLASTMAKQAIRDMIPASLRRRLPKRKK